MTESVKIVITPSVSDSDLLSVEDAMRQALDIFALLSRANELDRGEQQPVVWKLISASTNSPFTIEAAAYSSDPTYIPINEAVAAKANVGRALQAVLTGENVPDWVEQDNQSAALLKGILKRNLNGIGKTDIIFSNDATPFVISHRTATTGINCIERKALEKAAKKENFTHSAQGALEGIIIRAETHYSKPAIIIKDRNSGREIRCVISESSVHQVGANHSLGEVFQNKRVLVEGRLSYNSEGLVIRIDASEISVIEPGNVALDQIYDPNFTNGLPASEYLERLRDGNLD